MRIKFFDKLMDKLGYIVKSDWSNLWLKARESLLTGESVTDPYSQHQTVFMAIDAIAQNMPQVNFKIFSKRNDDEITDHPVITLLNAPNETMCRFQLWEATAIHLAVSGNAFWIFDESIGQAANPGQKKLPASIWPMNPDSFKCLKDSMGRLTGYRYLNKMTLAKDEVIHFKKFNRSDLYWGFSPLTPIKKTVDLDYKAQLYNRAFFDNSAEPMGYLTTEKSLSEQQFQRMLKQFEERHKGVNKAKRVALLEGGMEYSPAGESHKDMEFLEQRRYNREEILGTWRVPKSIFSITEDLNYATALAQKKLFWENTLKPLLIYIEEVLNAHFFPRFAPDVYGQFDLSSVPELQEDFHQKVTDAKTLFDMGFTANEINERLDLGFDEKDWRDFWWIPFGTIPAGEDFTGFEEPPAEEETDSKSNGKMKNEKWQKFMSLFGRMKDARRRKITWEHFSNSITTTEIQMEKRMKLYLFKLRGELLKELEKNFDDYRTKGFDDLAGFNWANYDDILKNFSSPFLLKGIKIGLENGKNALGGGGIDFDLLQPKVLAYLKERQLKITGINSRIRERVKKIAMEAIHEGQSANEAANEIRNLFNTTSARALAISRTEIVGSANGGQLLFFRESGVKKKEWLTARDEHVRESHAAQEGNVVELGKRFKNGLEFPGDPNGEPEEIINCRCTVVPVIE